MTLHQVARKRLIALIPPHAASPWCLTEDAPKVAAVVVSVNNMMDLQKMGILSFG